MTTYSAEQVWPPFSESLLEWDKAFHELMLNDRLRMTAYRQAIFETVKPGDRVLDLGTGTGILSLWALEAGAERVYGIELNAVVLQQAVERMARAGFAEAFEPINRLSYEVELPQRVDVLISEIIGNMADNEDFQPILQDAIQRFLKPDGIALPRSTSAYLVPVAAHTAHHDLRTGNIASLTPHYQIAELYRQKCIGTLLDISGDNIEGGGTSDSWKHAYLPIERPIDVQAGDQLTINFSRQYPPQGAAFRQVYRWRGQVERAEKIVGSFDQCMDESALLARQSAFA